MALNLNISSVTQSNDNTILRIIDGTGTYSSENIGGWGAPNTALSTINGTTNSLTLTITITDSSGVETIYEPIDVYNYLGHTPSTIDDLVIDVTCDMLIESGGSTAIGTDEDELPDGWYNIEYKAEIISTGVDIDSLNTQLLLDGVVRNKIYELLIYIPRTSYESNPNRIYTNNWEQLTFPIYVLSLFEAMLAYVTPARKNEILEMLNYIERLTV